MIHNQEKRINLSVNKAHISEILNIYTQDENTLHIRHPYSSQIKSSSTSICFIQKTDHKPLVLRDCNTQSSK
jgi:hypothetical protein